MARLFKPPTTLPEVTSQKSVFLAGSIEMGLAEDWQSIFVQSVSDLEINVFNPRRDEWDASWVQSIDNPQFREQVEWELNALERADLIAMYFAPQTKAPITLLELGLSAKSGKVFICCPKDYWRRGNIEIVCHRFDIPLFEKLEEWTNAIRLKCISE
jgi:hypothetical protein